MAAKTWHGEGSWKIGGGDVWHAITYDDATGLVIFGTAGADVGYGEMTGVKITGEKLFSQCIVAVKADTGEYLWHYQTGTEGVHSENNQIMMADLMINGEKRRVAMTAPKNGFFYILDATAGNLVFQGQGTGEFAAYSADTGKKLWSIQTKSAIDSIPVTFSVSGEQYVITSVGWGSGSRLFAPAHTMATPESKRGPNRLYAFKLGGKVSF